MFNLDTFLSKKVYQEIQVFENASWPFGLGTAVPFVNESDNWEIQPLICK